MSRDYTRVYDLPRCPVERRYWVDWRAVVSLTLGLSLCLLVVTVLVMLYA